MSTILKTENITNSQAAINAYRTTCIELYKSLQTEINTLVAEGFIGEGSNGYQEFFRDVTPALTTNLTGTEASITSLLDNLLTTVQQMLDPVDPQIGAGNRSAAQVQ